MTDTSVKRLGQRRRRLSDQESAERMIAAAMEMIRESGLTVSLDHISIEDVVRRADVSRTAAYRRWKYKDDFFADLLRELARDPHPAAAADQPRLEELRALVADHLDWVETADGRARLYAEVLRLTGARDLTMLATSHRWRSYISLQAAVLSQQEAHFRAELQGILAESERHIQRRTAANYAVLAEVFGRRLRRDAGVTFEHIAIMHDSVINGVALKALTDPSLLNLTIGGPPVAASFEPWSIPAAIAFAIEHLYTEPDPDVTWDRQRIAAVQGFMRRAAGLMSSGDLTLIQSEDGLRRLLNT